jgi:hypothetical protein
MKQKVAAPPVDGFRDREAIIRNVALINLLRDYVLGLQPLPAELPLPFAEADRPYLESSEGVELVRTWLLAFTATIGLTVDFRNELVHGLERPSDEDSHEVALASADTLRALIERVRRR